MLSTFRLGPLTYVDEVSALLIAVPYPHYRPSRPRDAEYGQLTALIEVESWLKSGPNNDQAPGDRHSLAANVRWPWTDQVLQ